MPLTRDQYPDFPFSHGNSATATLRLENFHLAVGNLRCFDATKNTPDKKPYFNWFDQDNCFIAGARKSPPYTEIFWILWLKIATNLGDAAKDIFEADTSAEIDALRRKTIKLDVAEGNEIITKEFSFITPDLRAMVDNICYMAVYGHNSLFEQRVPLARRTAFREYALKSARDNEDEFYISWKRYRAANPFKGAGGRADSDESESEKIMKLLGGDSDEDEAANSAAAASAAAAPAQAAAAPAHAPGDDSALASG